MYLFRVKLIIKIAPFFRLVVSVEKQVPTQPFLPSYTLKIEFISKGV